LNENEIAPFLRRKFLRVGTFPTAVRLNKKSIDFGIIHAPIQETSIYISKKYTNILLNLIYRKSYQVDFTKHNL